MKMKGVTISLIFLSNSTCSNNDIVRFLNYHLTRHLSYNLMIFKFRKKSLVQQISSVMCYFKADDLWYFLLLIFVFLSVLNQERSFVGFNRPRDSEKF